MKRLIFITVILILFLSSSTKGNNTVYNIIEIIPNQLYSVSVRMDLTNPIKNPTNLLIQGLKKIGQNHEIVSITPITREGGMTTSLMVFVKNYPTKEVLAESTSFESLEPKKTEAMPYITQTLIADELFSVTLNRNYTKPRNRITALNQGVGALCQKYSCQSITPINNHKSKTVAIIVVTDPPNQ